MWSPPKSVATQRIGQPVGNYGSSLNNPLGESPGLDPIYWYCSGQGGIHVHPQFRIEPRLHLFERKFCFDLAVSTLNDGPSPIAVHPAANVSAVMLAPFSSSSFSMTCPGAVHRVSLTHRHSSQLSLCSPTTSTARHGTLYTPGIQ